MIKLIDPLLEIPLIWEGDDAIDAVNSDMIEFARNPEEVSAHVRIKAGEVAARWFCRPLPSDVYQRALQQSRVDVPAGDDSNLRYMSQAVTALTLSLVRVENFHAAGDRIEGKELVAALKRVPWNIKFSLGQLVLTMSSGTRDSSPDQTLAARWACLLVASQELVEELVDHDIGEDGGIALERVREAIKPGSSTMDPESEGPGSDLGK